MICDGRQFAVSPIRAILLALLLMAGHATANPSGPTVVGGQATFSNQGYVLTVTNAPGTIINWQGFSVGTQDVTRFLQQSSGSAVLNRVIGGNPSAILGTLASNGQVFLVNPNGVVFGPSAQVNMASLTVSTGQISDGSFLAGVIPPPAPGSSTVTITPLNFGMFAGAYDTGLAGKAFSPPPDIGSTGNTAVNPGGTGNAFSPPPDIGSPGNASVNPGSAGNAFSPPPSIGSNNPVPTVISTPPSGSPGNMGGTVAVPVSGVTGTTTIGSSGIAIATVAANEAPIAGAVNPGVTITAISTPPGIGSSASSAATTGNIATDNTASASIATATVAPSKDSAAGSSPAPTPSALVILQKREPLF